MSLEEFKNLAAGIQSLIVAVAFVIGGIWAFYRFIVLKSIEKAKIELVKLKKELNSRAVLNIELFPSSVGFINEQYGYIILYMKIKNCGNSEEVINWKKSKIRAAEIKYNSKGDPKLGQPLLGYNYRLDGDPIYAVISPREQSEFSFIIPIEKVGLYLLDVKLMGSPREIETTYNAAKSVGLEAEEIFWTAIVYYEVTNNKI